MTMAVEKMSVSFEPELGEAIRAAAAGSEQGVSGWLAAAARDRLRLEALDQAVMAWEQEFGSLTQAEVTAAEHILDQPGSGRRPGAA